MGKEGAIPWEPMRGTSPDSKTKTQRNAIRKQLSAYYAILEKLAP